MNEKYVLELKGITKGFPGVVALKNVNLRVKTGEVHALVGENGAGKSTLLKIMYGIFPPDSGEILMDGKAVQPRSPSHAQHLGISLVHQELQQIPELSVMQNIFLAREITYPGNVFVNSRQAQKEAEDILQRIGVSINPRARIKSLGIAERQMVEIAKALLVNARLIAFDEPTSSLTNVETEKLFSLIRELKKRGVGIIYVSHRLEEIMQIADHVTVLRDGQLVGDAPVAELDQGKIVRMMIGKSLSGEAGDEDEFEKAALPPAPADAPEALRVVGLNTPKIKDASFSLRRGELVGIAGLMGSGRTELVRALYGADPAHGEVYVEGKAVHIHSPQDAIAAGIGFLPEDRKGQGLVRLLSMQINMSLAALPKMTRAGLVDFGQMKRQAQSFVEALDIQPPYLERLALNLSGGNQQKVILARWLLNNSEILIFDEPTRGIDVGSKNEIYQLMEALIGRGKSIIMVSSELPEVLRMSQRILVMREGRIVKELERSEATKEVIMYHATGGK